MLYKRAGVRVGKRQTDLFCGTRLGTKKSLTSEDVRDESSETLHLVGAVEAEGGEGDTEDVLPDRGAGQNGGGGGPGTVEHEEVLQDDDDGGGQDEADDAPVGLDLELLEQHLDQLGDGPDADGGTDEEREGDEGVIAAGRGVGVREVTDGAVDGGVVTERHEERGTGDAGDDHGGRADGAHEDDGEELDRAHVAEVRVAALSEEQHADDDRESDEADDHLQR